MAEEIITLSNIAKHYKVGTEIVKALRTISLTIYKNEYVALMGPSGSGKSTLMNILGCLDTPTYGTYILNKHDVSKQNPDAPLYKKYFMHGTSHFLGLDVHDIGNSYEKMKAGMVFTCEPGIYIAEEGLGIRIENDILITKSGNVDLMANIPIEADEIESLMN